MSRNNELIRANFKAALNSGACLQFPGAFNAMVGMLIEEHGFNGVYCSGAVASNSLGLTDTGLTTLEQVSLFVEQIIQKTNLPVVADADTGFESIVETVQEFERIGTTGIHLEDQVDAKLCGHLDGKQLVSRDEMVEKVKMAVNAKTDKNFQIIARTDAKSVEGINSAIDRAKAYIVVGCC